MKTNQLSSKALRVVIFAAAMTIGISSAFAQVKIGSNPTAIGANSNLEVESSNGTKVVVDKTTGFVGAGVTDPSQSIDGAGTGRLRNIPTSTTNTNILTVDPNGVIYKQNSKAATLPIIFGVKTAPGVNLLPDDVPRYTGTFIWLPANSKYIVTSTMLLYAGAALTTTSNAWIRSYFSDSPAGIRTTDVIDNELVSGSLSTGQIFSLATGTIILNNTSSSPKPYYYFGLLGSANGSYNLPAGFTIQYFGGTAYAENQLYGIPVN